MPRHLLTPNVIILPTVQNASLLPDPAWSEPTASEKWWVSGPAWAFSQPVQRPEARGLTGNLSHRQALNVISPPELVLP